MSRVAALSAACLASRPNPQSSASARAPLPAGGGVTDCYEPRQTLEARNKCLGELAQMQVPKDKQLVILAQPGLATWCQMIPVASLPDTLAASDNPTPT